MIMPIESDEVFLRCFGGVNPNSLMHVLNDKDPNDESLIGNEPQFILNSPYLNDEQLVKLIKTKPNSFSILSLNCQSIRAKFDQIKIFMH